MKAWDIWEENFNDAKKFFKSEGEWSTRRKLKDKWYENFMKNLHSL